MIFLLTPTCLSTYSHISHKMSSDEGPHAPSSEVGLDGARIEQEAPKSDAEKLLNNMEMFLSRVLAVQPTPTVSTNQATYLLPFNPDEPDCDIDGWCNITEAIVRNKRLEGIDLLMALKNLFKRPSGCLYH